MPLINPENGDIDQMALAEAIQREAVKEGGPNFTARDLRSATEWCAERADAERRQWFTFRGLPVPGEELVEMGAPAWGNSGDSFARGR